MSKYFNVFANIKNFLLHNLTMIIFFILVLNLTVYAQERDSTNQFKIDFFKMFDSSTEKMIELSNSIPLNDYNWSPANKVRSIKESLMHVASTHYYLASKLNYPVPERIKPATFKSVKTKTAAQEILINSINHIREAIHKIKNEQLYSTVNFWGREETMQRVILQAGEHMAEHLGQLIAYARMIGVAPPWSK